MIGWGSQRIPRSQFPQNAIAARIADCDWYFGYTDNAGACMSSAEVERAKQVGPYTDLMCYVEEARFAQGFLLTHCRAVPVPIDIKIARENQLYREQQVQHALSDLDLEVERLNQGEQ